MSWTDERVEFLKTMWSEGKSASQIAKELGGVTRNAVIGKVHRLGLSNRVGGADRPEDEIEVGAFAEAPTPEPVPEPQAEQPQAAGAAARPAVREPAAPAVRAKPAGQPMPPQPPGSEISPEALANLA
jgi:GcrA cell cycle regulator